MSLDVPVVLTWLRVVTVLMALSSLALYALAFRAPAV